MKAKQLNRALHDLAEEGVAQVFQPMLGCAPILGVVGALQFDVLQSRLQHEYGVPVRYEPAPCVAARWVREPDSQDAISRFVERNRTDAGHGSRRRLCSCPRANGCCARRWRTFRTSSS